jgi:3-oxoacyl-[acyl-carrier-protein] synthase-3
MVDTSDEWIIERTGIRERHIAAPDEATSDLAYHAARNAIERAGLSPKDIDAIIVATATPDMFFPATACLLQDRLGARNVACMDIEAACPGFIYSLDIARGFLELRDNYRTVLVVGAETLSRIVDWKDRNTCVLFGDGAGAAVLIRDDSEYGILSSYLGGDGSLANLLYMPAGGTRMPASHETVENRLHFVKMQGREVFKHAVLGMQRSSIRALKAAGVSPEEITWLVPHQANMRIIDATRERLGIPAERVYINIHKYGNTSAASIPIALAEMEEEGILKRGDIVLMVAFGAGFTWGATLVRWG